MSKIVFWDLDGTIIESLPGIAMSVRYLCDKLGHPYFDDETVSRMIGPPVSWAMREVFGFGENSLKATELFYEHYDVIGWKHSKVYAGVEDCMRQVVELGGKNYIATLKPHEMAQQIPAHFGLGDLMDGVYGATGEGDIKSNILKRAIETEKPEDAIMMGDLASDVIAAHDCNIRGVAVLYGYGDREALLAQNAWRVATDAHSLLDITRDFLNGE